MFSSHEVNISDMIVPGPIWANQVDGVKLSFWNSTSLSNRVFPLMSKTVIDWMYFNIKVFNFSSNVHDCDVLATTREG